MFGKRNDAYTALTVTDEQKGLLDESSNLAESRTSTGRFAEGAADVTELVQFTAPMFYATEDDEKAIIDVMRIGTLSDPISVAYKTEDGSALAGDKYTACEGVLEFEPGETYKTFEVPITEDDNFDTTLEFGITLYDPIGCELGKYLKTCRVLILDNDLFPSNDLKDEISSGDEKALQDVGMKVLMKYIWFTYTRVPTIWWKSWVIFFLDQLSNIYYYSTIVLRVYLVDKVLNMNFEDTDELLWPDNRFRTAMILGACYIVPSQLILLVEWLKVGPLDMGSPIQKHLRVNLFRKYLNYSEASREVCPTSMISTAMRSDVSEVVSNSYIAMFDLLRGLGKIGFVAYFILRKDKSSGIPMLIYPLAMLTFMYCRYGKQVRLASQASSSESATQDVLLRTVMGFGLITDYKQRSTVVERFQKLLGDQTAKMKALNVFNFWAEQLIPNMSVIFIGLYIAIGARLVLSEAITLGSFLATVNAYKDLGDRFESVSINMRNMFKIVDPLIGITRMLNMETDLGERMRRNRKRRQFVKDILQEEANQNKLPSTRHSVKTGAPLHMMTPFYDRLPIALDGIQIGHVASLSRVTTKVEQGLMVLITGPHSSGKQTLVGLLTDNFTPANGHVLCPSHLRCLHVSYSPEMITYMSLYENLVFGAVDMLPERVNKIFDRVVRGVGDDDDNSVHQAWLKEEFDKGMEAWKNDMHLEQESGSDPWHKRMSNNEKKRVHLARALIYNPEVLVLHRPVDEADEAFGLEILHLLREFCDCRGLELDDAEFPKRRPRTVFFTGGQVKEEKCTKHADIVWKLGGDGLIVKDKGAVVRRTNVSAVYDHHGDDR